eukprot:11848793-Alexandrium_andersonii.AAC.1
MCIRDSPDPPPEKRLRRDRRPVSSSPSDSARNNYAESHRTTPSEVAFGRFRDRTVQVSNA